MIRNCFISILIYPKICETSENKIELKRILGYFFSVRKLFKYLTRGHLANWNILVLMKFFTHIKGGK